MEDKLSDPKTKPGQLSSSLTQRVETAKRLLAECNGNADGAKSAPQLEAYIYRAFQERAIPGRVRTRPIEPLTDDARMKRCRELLTYWASGFSNVIDEDLVSDISQRQQAAAE